MLTGTAKQTFQLTAARRRLGHILSDGRTLEIVSTHSRPKAAGAARRLGWLRSRVFQLTAARRRLVLLSSPKRPSAGFNSQPPEGGWQNQPAEQNQLFGFNSQPPEGGWFCINFVNTSSGANFCNNICSSVSKNCFHDCPFKTLIKGYTILYIPFGV